MHVGNKRGSLPKRILGLLLALVILFPASLSALASGAGFETNLENLAGQQGSWTEGDDGLRGQGDGDCFAMTTLLAATLSMKPMSRSLGIAGRHPWYSARATIPKTTALM